MLEMLMQWYRRRFSDPEAIALLVILVAGFGILFFFSGLLAPLLVAIVLAYLLEWPTARLEHIGFSRRWATSIVLVLFVGILLLMAFVVMPVRTLFEMTLGQTLFLNAKLPTGKEFTPREISHLIGDEGNPLSTQEVLEGGETLLLSEVAEPPAQMIDSLTTLFKTSSR